MKLTVLLGFFTSSVMAMACPQLAGNYKCDQDEKQETFQHEVSITQAADTIMIEDKDAGYSEGPFLLKSVTRIPALHSDLLYRVTCTQDKIVIHGSGEKSSAVTIQLVKNSKGYSSTWQSKDETIKSQCKKI